MSQIIVPTNTGIDPSTGHRNGGCFLGVQDWDARLNFQDDAMSIVCAFNPAGTLVGAPDQPTTNGNDRWGFPIAVFAEMNSQSTPPSTTPQANSPKNGWGLFWSTRVNFWIWNNCPGDDNPTASTYRCLSINALDAESPGRWNRLCITKAAEASGTSDFACYVNGATGSLSDQGGTANSIGDVAEYAKMRWFHMANSFAQIISVSSMAAGVWVYNKALTATEGQNVTKVPGATGQVDPEDSSLLANLVARTYSGVRDWRAMSDSRDARGRPVFILPRR